MVRQASPRVTRSVYNLLAGTVLLANLHPISSESSTLTDAHAQHTASYIVPTAHVCAMSMPGYSNYLRVHKRFLHWTSLHQSPTEIL